MTPDFEAVKKLLDEARAKLSEVRAPIRIRTASDSVLIPGKRGFARGSDVRIRNSQDDIEHEDIFFWRETVSK
jgi:hypothetical protein